jgi:hypothetical protein
MRKIAGAVAFGLGLTLTAGSAGCEAAPAENNAVTASPAYADRDAVLAQYRQEGFVAPPIGQVVLNAGNMCRWLPDSPMPQPSDRSVQLMDGRCGFPIPQDGSPKNDMVGVYPMPFQRGKAVTRTESGSYVGALCFTIGQKIADGRGVQSQMWVLINTNEGRGFVPAFTTGYGLPLNAC